MLNTSKGEGKILLYGQIYRDYRSQLLIKILQESKYKFFVVSPEIYSPRNNWFIAKILDKVFIVFCLIEFFVKASLVDIIYLPPMNTRFIRSTIWAAKLFKKNHCGNIYINL